MDAVDALMAEDVTYGFQRDVSVALLGVSARNKDLVRGTSIHNGLVPRACLRGAHMPW